MGVHAARRANIDLGKRVLITGAGPIGMVSAIASMAKGGRFFHTRIENDFRGLRCMDDRCYRIQTGVGKNYGHQNCQRYEQISR